MAAHCLAIFGAIVIYLSAGGCYLFALYYKDFLCGWETPLGQYTSIWEEEGLLLEGNQTVGKYEEYLENMVKSFHKKY